MTHINESSSCTFYLSCYNSYEWLRLKYFQNTNYRPIRVHHVPVQVYENRGLSLNRFLLRRSDASKRATSLADVGQNRRIKRSQREV